jgi:hypothetical protein
MPGHGHKRPLARVLRLHGALSHRGRG